VHVFFAGRPLRLAGQTKTDDRGFYRFGELMPGPYIVRTAPSMQNDGASYLASYYPEGTDLRYVRSIAADLDRTWPNVDFPAVPGKLYQVRGKLLMPEPGFTSSIDLISDSGRQKTGVDDQGNFRFDNVAPGNYEFFAEATTKLGHFSAWQLFLVEGDSEVNVAMPMVPTLGVTIADDHYKRFPRNTIKVTARRKDLDKEGPEVPLREGGNQLAPGDWEFLVNGGAEYYPKDVRVSKARAERRSKDSAEGWLVGNIPFTPLNEGVPMAVTLSSRVASVKGHVMDKTNEPAPYAPVLLETIGLEPPDPQILREARAGSDGSFEFKGLPPGHYRILGTFDLDWSDRMAVDTARPADLHVGEGENATQDVMLYHKP
jgi:hypothetical protein